MNTLGGTGKGEVTGFLRVQLLGTSGFPDTSGLLRSFQVFLIMIIDKTRVTGGYINKSVGVMRDKR